MKTILFFILFFPIITSANECNPEILKFCPKKESSCIEKNKDKIGSACQEKIEKWKQQWKSALQTQIEENQIPEQLLETLEVER